MRRSPAHCGSLFALALAWHAPGAAAAFDASRLHEAARAVAGWAQGKREPPGRPATDPERRERILEIMERGSLNVSRTLVVGRRFMAPEKTSDEEIPRLARANFRKAAEYVVDNASELPLSFDTAERLNVILTKGLIPGYLKGDLVRNVQAVPEFYRWLEGPDAAALGRADPVSLASTVHDRVSALDAFADGNGRTARLMADLVLLKAGRAPAFYTDIEEYFARGNSRSEAPPEQRAEYFREICRRGEEALCRGVGAVEADEARPRLEFLEQLKRQAGQDGTKPPPR